MHMTVKSAMIRLEKLEEEKSNYESALKALRGVVWEPGIHNDTRPAVKSILGLYKETVRQIAAIESYQVIVPVEENK